MAEKRHSKQYERPIFRRAPTWSFAPKGILDEDGITVHWRGGPWSPRGTKLSCRSCSSCHGCR